MGRGSPRGRFSSVNQFASPPASNPPGFFGNEAPHTVGLLFGRMRGGAAGTYPAGIVVERAKGHVDCPMLFAVVILGFELSPERIVEVLRTARFRSRTSETAPASGWRTAATNPRYHFVRWGLCARIRSRLAVRPSSLLEASKIS